MNKNIESYGLIPMRVIYGNRMGLYDTDMTTGVQTCSDAMNFRRVSIYKTETIQYKNFSICDLISTLEAVKIYFL